MGRSLLTLKDAEKVAIKNRLGKIIRFIGEHVISKEFLVEHYGEGNDLLSVMANPDEKEQDIALIDAIALTVFDRAMKGEIRALEFIRDTIGERPATNVMVTDERSTNLSNLTLGQLTQIMQANNKPIQDVEDGEIITEQPNDEEIFK